MHHKDSEVKGSMEYVVTAVKLAEVVNNVYELQRCVIMSTVKRNWTHCPREAKVQFNFENVRIYFQLLTTFGQTFMPRKIYIIFLD